MSIYELLFPHLDYSLFPQPSQLDCALFPQPSLYKQKIAGFQGKMFNGQLNLHFGSKV
jgi:hypothetical protein